MFAAIDLGTNSARLLVGTVENNRVNIIRQHRIPARMGEGLKGQGLIQKEAMMRTIGALQEFRQILAGLPIIEADIFATSAARRAANKDELADVVKNIFGKSLRILSGEEEAKLNYAGAVSVAPDLCANAIPAVVDIGGGSVEVCTLMAGQMRALSMELGAVRCTDLPLSELEIGKLLEPMVRMLSGISRLFLVGVGGTVTTLAAVQQSLAVYDSRRVHGCLLDRQGVSEMLRLFNSLPLEERKHLPGLEPERADIIVAGTKILKIVMEKLGTNTITVSEADLLHGVLKELAGAG